MYSMQLRLSTPFEPYGRYLSAENVEVQENDSFSTSEEFSELIKAFKNKAAELIREFNEISKSSESSAQEEASYGQTEKYLGSIPGVFNPAEGIDALQTDSSPLFDESSIAHRWMNAVAFMRKAANSKKLPTEKERDMELARARLVRVADDFKADAISAARASVLFGGYFNTQAVFLQSPPPSDEADYEEMAKQLKKTFSAMSLSLSASALVDNSSLMMAVPCAVLVEYCGMTMLMSCDVPPPIVPSPPSRVEYSRISNEHIYGFFKPVLEELRFDYPDKVVPPQKYNLTQYKSTSPSNGEVSEFFMVRPNFRLLRPVEDGPIPRTELYQFQSTMLLSSSLVEYFVNILNEWTDLPTKACFMEELFHFYGLKLSQMYEVLTAIYQHDKQDELSDWVIRIKEEMIARAFHKIVNHELRGVLLSSSPSPSARLDAVKRVLVNRFNQLLGCCFGDRPESQTLWSKIVMKCQQSYQIPNQQPLIINPMNETNALLLVRLATVFLGVEWRPDIAAQLVGEPKSFNSKLELKDFHIIDVHPRVKQMHLVAHCHGVLASLQQRVSPSVVTMPDYNKDQDDPEMSTAFVPSSLSQVSKPVDGTDLLLKDDNAMTRFLEAFHQQPRNAETLREISRCYRRRWCYLQTSSRKSKDLLKMSDFFISKAIQCNFVDSKTLFDFAVLQDQRANFKLSDDLCARAVSNSNDPSMICTALTLRGDLNVTKGFRVEPTDARYFYLRAIKEAGLSGLPSPHAKVNYAILLCKHTQLIDYYAAGCALLQAVDDSGYQPSSALLCDLAEFSQAVLHQSDMSHTFRLLQRAFHPDFALRTFDTSSVSSSSKSSSFASPFTTMI